MYMVVALVYMLSSANAPIDAPIPVNGKISFMSLEQCQEYLQSEQFAMDKMNLHRSLLLRLHLLAAAGTQPTEEIPAIAITASCQEDHRV